MASSKQEVKKEKIINFALLGERLKSLPKVNYNVLMVALLVLSAFLIGRLSAQVEYLKGGAGSVQAQPTPVPTQPAKVEVTLDQLKSLFDGKKYITFGDKNKKLIFLEFSDPSCPYCHIAGGLNPSLNKQVDDGSGRKQFTVVADGGTYIPPVPEMRKLVDQGKAAFVWIYANGHGNGEMGVKAMYCANEKGKFWQVHDLLMNKDGYDLLNNVVKNDKTKSNEMANFLRSVINPTEMKNCLDSGRYDNRPAEDMVKATEFGFNGTPDFYVNTTNFVGAYSFTEMKAAVDAGLK